MKSTFRNKYFSKLNLFPSSWEYVTCNNLFQYMNILCWRSLMTLLYLEWQFSPWWLLRSICARFPEQLLKGLASWGNPGKYSLIGHFLRDAFGGMYCLFWCAVLQCDARLPIHTLNYWTVQSVVPVS